MSKQVVTLIKSLWHDGVYHPIGTELNLDKAYADFLVKKNKAQLAVEDKTTKVRNAKRAK